MMLDINVERVEARYAGYSPLGLIIAGLEHTSTAQRMMVNSGIPIAEIMDVDGQPIDMNIGISHEKAGYDMGRLIVEKGYKNIGFIGTKLDTDFRAGKRLQGFKKALSEARQFIVDHEFYTGNSSLRIGKDVTQKLLERNAGIDCIYYSNDLLAAGGLMHCIAHDISVPKQLGIAGFNGLELREGLPKLTATTYAYRKEIGEQAAKMIIAAYSAGKKRNYEKVTFAPKIEIGDTL